MGKDCGNCLLYPGCGYCQINKNISNFSCVPGGSSPYLKNTCTAKNEQYYTMVGVEVCRQLKYYPALIPVTCVVVVLITILVVATYVVDWRLQKKKTVASRGYGEFM